MNRQVSLWVSGMVLSATPVLASTLTAPWAVPTATLYDSIITTWFPFVMAIVIVGAMFIGNRFGEQEGVMGMLVQWGTKVAIGGGSLAMAGFFMGLGGGAGVPAAELSPEWIEPVLHVAPWLIDVPLP